LARVEPLATNSRLCNRLCVLHSVAQGLI
jgi:hypothetical protein